MPRVKKPRKAKGQAQKQKQSQSVTVNISKVSNKKRTNSKPKPSQQPIPYSYTQPNQPVIHIYHSSVNPNQPSQISYMEPPLRRLNEASYNTLGEEPASIVPENPITTNPISVLENLDKYPYPSYNDFMESQRVREQEAQERGISYDELYRNNDTQMKETGAPKTARRTSQEIGGEIDRVKESLRSKGVTIPDKNNTTPSAYLKKLEALDKKPQPKQWK